MEANNCRVDLKEMPALPPGDLHPGTVALFGREFNIAQRTPEWYLARKSLITASDCAAALSIKPFAGFKGNVRQEALESKFRTWAGNIFCAHGQVRIQ